MGDPFFDLGNFSINHELTPGEDEILLAAYDGAVRPDRLARLTLMRVVSDFREAMWGVLQQGVSTLDVDFVAYADGRLRPAAGECRRSAVRARARRGGRGADAVGSSPMSRPATLSPMTDPRRRLASRGRRARGRRVRGDPDPAVRVRRTSSCDARSGTAAASPARQRATDGRRSPRSPTAMPRPPVPARRARRHRPRLGVRRAPTASSSATRSWSAPATSPTARSTTTARPRTSSTRSPAPSSPPATTPTRTARADAVP